MEILIGLAIATIVVYGWWSGSKLAAVFMTLPTGATGAIALVIAVGSSISAVANGAMIVAAIAGALLALIWAPIYIRTH